MLISIAGKEKRGKGESRQGWEGVEGVCVVEEIQKGRGMERNFNKENES